MKWGHACLTYLYLVMDTLSRGTLCQLAGPWKLLEVRLFPFSHIVSQIVLRILANCIGFTCYLGLQTTFYILPNCTFLSCKPYLHALSYKLSSRKLYLTFLQTIFACSILQIVSYFLANYYLANCSHALSCKLSSCKLSSCYFLANYHLANYVFVLFL